MLIGGKEYKTGQRIKVINATRIGRGMPTQAYYSCICVKD